MKEVDKIKIQLEQFTKNLNELLDDMSKIIKTLADEAEELKNKFLNGK